MKPKAKKRSYLSPARQRLFDQLAGSGRLLATPVVEDQFSQMPASECRAFVLNMEKYLRKFIGQVS